MEMFTFPERTKSTLSWAPVYFRPGLTAQMIGNPCVEKWGRLVGCWKVGTMGNPCFHRKILYPRQLVFITWAFYTVKRTAEYFNLLEMEGSVDFAKLNPEQS